MTVIPLKSLFSMVLIWLIANLIDVNFLHWFALSPREIFAETYWQVMLVLACWVFCGRKLPSEASA